MDIFDLSPFGRRRAFARPEEMNSWWALNREINRLVQDLWREGGSTGQAAPFTGGSWPSLDITETDQAFRVIAELPGIDESDIEIMVDDDVLTLRGEKRNESSPDVQHSERFYGRFQRQLRLGVSIDRQAVSAEFAQGVLTITLPKAAVASTSRRIPIAQKGATAVAATDHAAASSALSQSVSQPGPTAQRVMAEAKSERQDDRSKV